MDKKYGKSFNKQKKTTLLCYKTKIIECGATEKYSVTVIMSEAAVLPCQSQVPLALEVYNEKSLRHFYKLSKLVSICNVTYVDSKVNAYEYFNFF